MKNLIFCLACFCTACGAPAGFTDAERETITSQQGGIMRLSTVADHEDSLLLRRPAAPLGREELTSDLLPLLMQGMLATVQDPADAGVGIAAPQVGVSRRLVAVQRFDKPGEPFEFYLNPEIVSASGVWFVGREGCLSVPGVMGDVLRSDTVVVNYLDARSQLPAVDTIAGFTAVIFQHEIDHLDGVLFIDKLQPADSVLAQ